MHDVWVRIAGMDFGFYCKVNPNTPTHVCRFLLLSVADDFIEELLLSSPSVLHGADGSVALTDPFGLSEKIIQVRNDIFLEWIEAMTHVPTAHQDGVRKRLLDKQMEAWNEYLATTKPQPSQQTQTQNGTSTSGDFQ